MNKYLIFIKNYKKPLILGIIILLVGIVSTLYYIHLSETSSVTIDVHLLVITGPSVSGNIVSVFPDHQQITINDVSSSHSTSKIVTFNIHINEIGHTFFLDKQLCVGMYNTEWGGYVECPASISFSNTNDMKLEVVINNVIIALNDMQSIYIVYNEI
jgi:hypothetical protein